MHGAAGAHSLPPGGHSGKPVSARLIAMYVRLGVLHVSAAYVATLPFSDGTDKDAPTLGEKICCSLGFLQINRASAGNPPHPPLISTRSRSSRCELSALTKNPRVPRRLRTYFI